MIPNPNWRFVMPARPSLSISPRIVEGRPRARPPEGMGHTRAFAQNRPTLFDCLFAGTPRVPLAAEHAPDRRFPFVRKLEERPELIERRFRVRCGGDSPRAVDGDDRKPSASECPSNALAVRGRHRTLDELTVDPPPP